MHIFIYLLSIAGKLKGEYGYKFWISVGSVGDQGDLGD